MIMNWRVFITNDNVMEKNRPTSTDLYYIGQVLGQPLVRRQWTGRLIGYYLQDGVWRSWFSADGEENCRSALRWSMPVHLQLGKARISRPHCRQLGYVVCLMFLWPIWARRYLVCPWRCQRAKSQAALFGCLTSQVSGRVRFCVVASHLFGAKMARKCVVGWSKMFALTNDCCRSRTGRSWVWINSSYGQLNACTDTVVKYLSSSRVRIIVSFRAGSIVQG